MIFVYYAWHVIFFVFCLDSLFYYTDSVSALLEYHRSNTVQYISIFHIHFLFPTKFKSLQHSLLAFSYMFRHALDALTPSFISGALRLGSSGRATG